MFISVHKLTLRSFPPLERFELSSQSRKAAYSVGANIVEGFARRHKRERLRFLNISEGSLAEVGYCLHVAHRLGYINENTLAEFERELNGVGAPLTGLIHSVRISKDVVFGAVFIFGFVLGRWIFLRSVTFLPSCPPALLPIPPFTPFPPFPPFLPYSYRNAITGSIRVARRAGR